MRLITPDAGYFTYSWDAAGRISVLQNPLLEVTTFGFDVIGRQALQVLANGTRASYTYDAGNNLTSLANLNSSSTGLSSFAYGYDPAGLRLGVTEVSGDRVTWAYDPTYQLVREVRDGVNAYNITHIWDSVGNRLVKNETGTLTTATYNAGNELVWSNGGTGRTTFTFDGAGNLSLKLSPALAATSYCWDGDNHLLQVALPTSIVNTMVYNADGLRVEKDDSTGTTKSVWDGQNVLLDANASNITQALYTLQPNFFGNMLSQSRSGSSSFYQFDALGSVVALTNVAQAVTDAYQYKAFGELLSGTGTTENPWRFIGRHGYVLTPDLSQYYIRVRQYDPISSRFLSKDPLIESLSLGGQDQLFSAIISGMSSRFAFPGMASVPPMRTLGEIVSEAYSYVRQQPTLLIDPSGMIDHTACSLEFRLCAVLLAGGVAVASWDALVAFITVNPWIVPMLELFCAASPLNLLMCAVGAAALVMLVFYMMDIFSGAVTK